MDTALLQTKLFVPQLRPPIVSRPGLLKRLNAGLFTPTGLFDRKLTLISAPAGFGKTTLISEWINQKAEGGRLILSAAEGMKDESETLYPSSFIPHPSKVAWLSLDERDNDLARLLTYVIAALQRVEPGIGQATLPPLSGPGSPDMEPVLTTLINEIAQIPAGETGDGQPFVLVLDDYHLIQARPVHSALAFLLEHLPPQMHLVIATRVEPPFSLARLRGRGHLAEFRADDLRFSPEQAGQFLNEVMKLNLSTQLVDELSAYTEGWIAGLKMAAVSLQGRSAQTRSALYQGSSRVIGDYLLEEVLQSQPAAVQEFLLQTAILERLSGPLCDAVTGRQTGLKDGRQIGLEDDRQTGLKDGRQTGSNDGQANLERIERANLFIVPLDAEQKWYRYHHLFAGFLQKRLERTDPALMPLLHRRASAWYAANGLPALAVKHTLAAADVELAAALIEQVLDQTLMRGEFISLLNWLDSLPARVVGQRPRLSVYHALVMILTGRPLEEVDTKIREAAEGDSGGVVAGEVALLKALLAVLRGDGQRGYELSLAALELLPEDDRFLQSLLFRNLATVHKLTGDVRAARWAIEESARIAQLSGDRLGKIVTGHQLAEVSLLSGQLHEALLYCQGALELAVDGEGRPMLVAAKVLVLMGEIYREWNDLDSAAATLTQAIDLAGQWVELWGMGGYIVLARVRQAQGDLTATRKALQVARTMAVSYDASEVDDLFVDAYQARLWLLQDNLVGTLRWAQERGLAKRVAGDRTAGVAPTLEAPINLQEFESITMARLYLAQGDYARAREVLAPLFKEAVRLGRSSTVIEIGALQALALQGLERYSEATALLQRTLTLAEPGSYMRLFIEMGPAMAQLLGQLVQKGLATEYADRLLAAFGVTREADQPAPPPTQSLVEPLSQREMEVLRLLTSHLTSTEIASELDISANTVRFHTKNIYSKLGVHSRAGAVEKARALALL